MSHLGLRTGFIHGENPHKYLGRNPVPQCGTPIRCKIGKALFFCCMLLHYRQRYRGLCANRRSPHAHACNEGGCCSLRFSGIVANRGRCRLLSLGRNRISLVSLLLWSRVSVSASPHLPTRLLLVSVSAAYSHAPRADVNFALRIRELPLYSRSINAPGLKFWELFGVFVKVDNPAPKPWSHSNRRLGTRSESFAGPAQALMLRYDQMPKTTLEQAQATKR